MRERQGEANFMRDCSSVMRRSGDCGLADSEGRGWVLGEGVDCF
jgi:hypothetical protein